MRYFSVSEAEALIPELEKIYGEIGKLAAQARAKAATLQDLEADPSKTTDAVIARAQLQHMGDVMNAWLQKVFELGAIPKGLDPALVDFPHRLEGGEVYLCWQVGEDRITHYHGLDEGFAGRKPLPKARQA